MHWAARCGSIPIINILKLAGADEDAVSVHDWTPRSVAIYHQKNAVLASLQTHNSEHSMKQADVNGTSQDVSGHHYLNILCSGCFLVR